MQLTPVLMRLKDYDWIPKYKYYPGGKKVM